jgi:sugar lactone lactonase YvrE
MTFARRDMLAAGLAGFAALTSQASAEQKGASQAESGTGVASDQGVPGLELAMLANAPSNPTGITLSRSGRVFVMMPRFNAKVPFTLGEVMPNGSVTPYPDEATNQPDPKASQHRLLHVPNGVMDRDDRLWVLDAGLPDGSGPPMPGGAKLVRFDLTTNRIAQVVPLEAGVTATSSLNDLRVDLRDGRAVAFITDQGQDGHGAILAVDLASGRVTRRLARHASTESQKGIVKVVENRQILQRKAEGPPRPVQGGANGIALSPDGRRLYYAPLMGRRLYAVETALLLDPAVSDAEVAAAVEDLGEKGMTGGLIADSKDRVYLALQEHNAVGRRETDGTVTILATDPRLIWADTFWITPDRWLYITAAQVNRSPDYNNGRDLRQPPYAILRMRIDADPA